jgi:hypothetical protein
LSESWRTRPSLYWTVWRGLFRPTSLISSSSQRRVRLDLGHCPAVGTPNRLYAGRKGRELLVGPFRIDRSGPYCTPECLDHSHIPDGEVAVQLTARVNLEARSRFAAPMAAQKSFRGSVKSQRFQPGKSSDAPSRSFWRTASDIGSLGVGPASDGNVWELPVLSESRNTERLQGLRLRGQKLPLTIGGIRMTPSGVARLIRPGQPTHGFECNKCRQRTILRAMARIGQVSQ